MDQVILTKEGFQKLSEELGFLKSTKRKEAANALEKARAHGDLRENAEYDAAKLAKQQLEARIQMLEDKLGRAKVVDTQDAPTDKVYFGTIVEVKNENTGDTLKFTLVAEDEADIAQGKISIQSPIARALLGRQLGEVAEARVPAGVIKYKILKISR
ncbi:MAG: transcription elongation factor GreA [Omnitrophica bacterium RIFCSPLOWO2_12_FULL_44_17]|uniref:Transcription elongation factor GreA n=1 Tax=Candidatus Danuiimicrobium aquiferis TaxID=1801832 RepID=A0A1G1KU78_9BACT|nr:MAG: transcription elongation factor GreA [Omnitrophica bacterium RIFCSPHIGHO2_02_FULL_45_28]OGW91507.1 MAG: transcription elongation factor GreA [Omnitrophica bacterium RIFCSPHIGHO2_12_FULL_44_12]OGW96109.1 MAG: transcription elongation factor GreA [Omnitrophica bacterium RIFCSPLOWO2_12_FULL_44_17]OGX04658.1 MAG: transcription elongation factor GreA [Omnitrophica bacterium RIFCSPLOWO2_02_FULL_44_11]